jgi:pimeloyl-ACP methyl ester carboxylesterase
MGPKTRSIITIKGRRVSYYKLGHGEPLIFLHGGRVRALTFHKLIEQLAKSYTVIAPDIPGYGDSETPKTVWSFADYANCFDSFLRELKLDSATVMGYSMGGGIAFNLAACSNRVSQLILIDASGLPLSNIKQSHHDIRRFGFYLTHLQYISTLRTLAEDFLRFVWKHRRDWKHMKAIRHHCYGTSYENALRHIGVPTIILWGQDDWVFPVETAEAFGVKIPQADVHIVRGNHDWPLYNPLQVGQYIDIVGTKSSRTLVNVKLVPTERVGGRIS